MFSRILSGVLSFAFIVCPVSTPTFAQQGANSPDGTAPKKVLTPEQRAYQAQYRQWAEAHRAFQVQAKEVLDEVSAGENVKDCPDANNNYEFTTCFGKMVDTADQNLSRLEVIIHQLQAPPPAMAGEAKPPVVGVAGPILTPEELSVEFDTVEQTWRQFRTAACTAAFHQFVGGTGGPSFQAECALKLTRDHIHELDMIYGMGLHL